MKNENFRVPEREELPQEEKNDEKTRGPELQKMPEEGEENEKVRESESEKVAEPLPANKKRIEANKLSPEANTFSRGKVMVNLSHSKLKRKGHTEEKYVPAAKISRKQMEVSSNKHPFFLHKPHHDHTKNLLSSIQGETTFQIIAET